MDTIIKTFVDNGIEWLKQKNLLMRPDPNMPDEMLDTFGVFSNDWKPWKAITSVVTDSELNEVECRIGHKLPNSFKSFLKYKHFYAIKTNANYEPFRHIIYKWQNEFYERNFNEDLREFMLDKGYVCFGDFEDWGFLCFDTSKSVNDDNEYPVVLIDHETIDQQQQLYSDFKQCLIKNTITF